MSIDCITAKKALNTVFFKLPVLESEIQKLSKNLEIYIKSAKDGASEEYHKGLIKDFMANTWYAPNYSVNTNNTNELKEDLVIFNGNDTTSKPTVIIEAKSPTNVTEMFSEKNQNCKALQECVYYFLQENLKFGNNEIKHIIITNYEDFYIFDAKDFSRFFLAKTNPIVDQFYKFEAKQLTDNTTAFFYENCAKPAIEKWIDCEKICVTHVTPRTFYNQGAESLIPLYKIFSPEHLLAKPFANDSNSLDRNFYSELLHIIGLEEVKDGNKKLIKRKSAEKRESASLIESAIYQLEEEISNEDKCFETALHLVITWVNRLLFLKLVESQQVAYQKGNSDYKFLTEKLVADFDELNILFFKVLGRKVENRDSEVREKFRYVPYLNSSLFEISEEESFLQIRGIKNKPIKLYNKTVLKDEKGKRLSGTLDNLAYIFRFLDAYNFSSDSAGGITQNSKTLINASVLGLIFEKINGYKDGSFFTPGFITEYMAKETVERAVIQKFNDVKEWKCKNLDELADKIEDRLEANEIFNSIRICDPAVGSGHFLVSVLNRLIYIKSYLDILLGKNGNRIKRKEWELRLENDEISILDEDGNPFIYTTNPVLQRVQEAIFTEKRTLIENCLFGVDINPASVYNCRLRLWIELLKNTYYTEESGYTQLETLPNIDINIKCGNSLVSKYVVQVGSSVMEQVKNDGTKSSEYKTLVEKYKKAVKQYKNESNKEAKHAVDEAIRKIKGRIRSVIQLDLFDEKLNEKAQKEDIFRNSLEWMFEFPEVLDDEGRFVGFDVIIGNPPYIQLQANKGLLANLYEDFGYETFFKMGDIYLLFVERGYQLLKPDGTLSFINPNTWLQSISFSPFRKFVTTHFAWNSIALTNKVFDEPTVDTHCIYFIKSCNQTDCNIFRLEQDITPVFLHKIEKKFISDTENVINIEQNSQKRSIIEKIQSKSKHLSDFFDIYNGVKPFEKGKGKPAQTAETLKIKPFVKEGEKPDEEWSPLLRGSLIGRYENKWNNNYWILYGEWLAAPRDKKIFDAPKKIVVRQTGDSIIATVIGSGIICRDNLHICVPKLNITLSFVLGILNSKLTDFYYEFLNPEKGESLAQVKKDHVVQLLIPVSSPEQQKTIIDLVDKILSAKKEKPSADTTALEAEIDHLVYALYGLTEDEIKIVERRDIQ